MFAKTHSTAFLIVAILAAMFVEWQYFAVTREARLVHYYHGLCNGGVGNPYVDFIHRLRVLDENGDTKGLTRALRKADEHSHDIYNVWLYDKPGAYRESTVESLK